MMFKRNVYIVFYPFLLILLSKRQKPAISEHKITQKGQKSDQHGMKSDQRIKTSKNLTKLIKKVTKK